MTLKKLTIEFLSAGMLAMLVLFLFFVAL